MKQQEKDLFLHLCNLRSPNEKKLRKFIQGGNATSNVLGMLFANRMAGIAHHVLKQCELLNEVDREFRTSLQNAAFLNQKRNENYLECVRYLSSELNSCGVPYALLKGAYLCHWYPVGCRTSNDIDILVRPEDVSKVSEKLKLCGFRQGYLQNGVFVPATRQQIIESKMTRGETVPFIKKVGLPFLNYLEVDLNFSLDYQSSDSNTLEEMLSRSQIMGIGFAKIRTLEKTDFLIHLCAHLYKEATTLPWVRMKRDMTFYKYCDIYLLLETLTPNEEAHLLSQARVLGLEKELAYCLWSLNSFFRLTTKELTHYIRSRNNADLDLVVAPTEKKSYYYTETDPKKRFFKRDRVSLLREVTE